jgi:hypothetical protein
VCCLLVGKKSPNLVEALGSKENVRGGTRARAVDTPGCLPRKPRRLAPSVFARRRGVLEEPARRSTSHRNE